MSVWESVWRIVALVDVNLQADFLILEKKVNETEEAYKRDTCI